MDAIYHIIVDLPCDIFKFAINVGQAQPGIDFMINLKKGRHIFEFVSIECNKDRLSLVVEVPENDIEDFITVKLTDIRNERIKNEIIESERITAHQKIIEEERNRKQQAEELQKREKEKEEIRLLEENNRRISFLNKREQEQHNRESLYKKVDGLFRAVKSSTTGDFAGIQGVMFPLSWGKKLSSADNILHFPISKEGLSYVFPVYTIDKKSIVFVDEGGNEILGTDKASGLFFPGDFSNGKYLCWMEVSSFRGGYLRYKMHIADTFGNKYFVFPDDFRDYDGELSGNFDKFDDEIHSLLCDKIGIDYFEGGHYAPFCRRLFKLESNGVFYTQRSFITALGIAESGYVEIRPYWLKEYRTITDNRGIEHSPYRVFNRNREQYSFLLGKKSDCNYYIVEAWGSSELKADDFLNELTAPFHR